MWVNGWKLTGGYDCWCRVKIRAVACPAASQTAVMLAVLLKPSPTRARAALPSPLIMHPVMCCACLPVQRINLHSVTGNDAVFARGIPYVFSLAPSSSDYTSQVFPSYRSDGSLHRQIKSTDAVKSSLRLVPTCVSSLCSVSWVVCRASDIYKVCTASSPACYKSLAGMAGHTHRLIRHQCLRQLAGTPETCSTPCVCC
jgi:hypothetical protein